MKLKEVLEFIDSNEESEIKDYLNHLLSKKSEIDKENNRISFYLILLTVTYFLFDSSLISSIQLGTISLNGGGSLKVIIPPLFSFYCLRYIVLTNHTSEIIKNIRILSIHVYKQSWVPEDLETNNYSDFLRTLLPFSFWAQMVKGIEVGKAGFMSALIGIMVIPLILVLIIPHGLVVYWIIEMSHSWKDSLIVKLSIISSGYIMVYVALYFLKSAIVSSLEQKTNLELIEKMKKNILLSQESKDD
ncbi:hypothetical protein [Roseivirga seohaensis]|uniref:hypothetical protein n=1 Tax=Roseivirga seohaensis TaxID=1914963 RepID=UPI003BA94AE6